MRGKLLDNATYATKGTLQFIAEGLSGIDNANAWKLREKLVNTNSYGVADSLTGLDSQKAWDMRKRLMDQEPNLMASSLRGLWSAQAYMMRWRLLDKIKDDDFIAALALVDLLE
jgi:hypothetical protein